MGTMRAGLGRYVRAASIMRRIYAGERRSRWSRERLDAYRQARLDALVRHARERSKFYAELYSGKNRQGPVVLTDLPTTTKALLMDNFDDVVTDPRLKLDRARQHAETLGAASLYLDEYHVVSTSGSTGRPGLVVFNRSEWDDIFAFTGRAGRMTGMRLSLIKPPRVCLIGSDNPRHLSRAFSESNDMPLTIQHRITPICPVAQMVKELQDFQPTMMVGYPSSFSILALEQLAGRLHIEPEIVMTAAEVRTPEMAANIKRAWGVDPYNMYGTTEGFIGADCSHHRGIHIFEDEVIVEVVDEHYRPVPDGTQGAKILLTNLGLRTQPFIRFEVGDLVTIRREPCLCGSPFKLIAQLSGRSDDYLPIEGIRERVVRVHPLTFWTVLDPIAELAQYQVVLRTDGLHLLLVPRERADLTRIVPRIADELGVEFSKQGAKIPVLHPTIVDSIARDKSIGAKMKLVCNEVVSS
jgi:phenylacetate-CoA ligase